METAHEARSKGPGAEGGRIARRRQRTRAALVAAGTRAFLDRGPRRVSVEELLVEADVSRATFYKYFSSKYNLLEEILDPVYELLRAGLAALESRSDADVVDGLIEVWVAAYAEHGSALRLLARLQTEPAEAPSARQPALAETMLAALARAERADVLRNASARYSAELLTRVVAPLLEVYAGRPGAEALVADALGALLKRSHRDVGGGRATLADDSRIVE